MCDECTVECPCFCIGGHVGRCPTTELVEVAHLILTFEFAQHMLVIERWPEAACHGIGLHRFTDAVDQIDATLSELALVDEAALVSHLTRRRGTSGTSTGRADERRDAAEEIDEALLRIVPAP